MGQKLDVKFLHRKIDKKIILNVLLKHNLTRIDVLCKNSFSGSAIWFVEIMISRGGIWPKYFFEV